MYELRPDTLATSHTTQLTLEPKMLKRNPWTDRCGLRTL